MIYLNDTVAQGWLTALFLPGLPLLAAALGVGPIALSIGHTFGDDSYVPVYAAAGVVLSALVMTRMWLLIQRQRWLAVTDGLTGLRTRRYFEETLATAIARNARAREPFGVLLLDVDFFKKVNDTRGHGAGDRVLQELARRLLTVVRAGDVVARYGGEEFAVLLAHAGPAETRQVAERLRGTIAAEPIPTDDGPPLTITVSIGVAAGAVPGVPDNSAQLMLQADRCLYTAKEQGRDRVVAGPEFDRITA
ncbi:GGDEF domain-containing protein [Actinoplanes derwentensis]|uniref:Diguanylate cyclase (GGDEF) domain-containing protein n=1 Tax=Actinoplanes derwentensis TaxID=113562 RepID=A0A1H1ZCX3_9ACTN|nr:GGDEF domain-containing protein [Actinoplanes derwentensis]GID82352.1 hypothetical protein Ade03nite_12760 [Actinoplanes derwentensis]SDT31056.1 diguanylate cyclase (GGDEF) domain-containing protein [Actinoplanes derwentensis]